MSKTILLTGIGALLVKMIEESGLHQKLVGKTLEEAKGVELNAVSGATFSSTAIIKNIELGLEDGGASAASATTA